MCGKAKERCASTGWAAAAFIGRVPGLPGRRRNTPFAVQGTCAELKLRRSAGWFLGISCTLAATVCWVGTSQNCPANPAEDESAGPSPRSRFSGFITLISRSSALSPPSHNHHKQRSFIHRVSHSIHSFLRNLQHNPYRLHNLVYYDPLVILNYRPTSHEETRIHSPIQQLVQPTATMLVKSIAALAALTFAANVAAEPMPYKPTMMKTSARSLFGLMRRDDQSGYQPEPTMCGDGNTCAEACGTGYETCSSVDSQIHCFNPAAGELCCPDKSGST